MSKQPKSHNDFFSNHAPVSQTPLPLSTHGLGTLSTPRTSLLLEGSHPRRCPHLPDEKWENPPNLPAHQDKARVMGHPRVPKCPFHSPRGSQRGWEQRVCLSQSPTALPPAPCTDQGVGKADRCRCQEARQQLTPARRAPAPAPALKLISRWVNREVTARRLA